MLRLIRLMIKLGWPIRLAGPLFGRFNPFRPAYRKDPYPVYRRMREAARPLRCLLLG